MKTKHTQTLHVLSLIGSVALTFASWRGLVPISLTEVFGFISGGLCVWLTVKQNIWNWPIGIVNNIFFIILFWQSHLYADMALQVVYIVLSILGWYWWVRGGVGNTSLTVSRIGIRTVLVLTLIGVVTMYGMTLYLRTVQDAAPFLDALTTVMSLIAQYLLTKKKIENWYLWMTADVIYVWLYCFKHLYLTGFLYAIFFAMCIAGVIAWRRSMKLTNKEAVLTAHHV
ncbi:MAG: nicotinamide riboside transporter PnuC [Candidatus Paceibacterota bacterium]